MPVLRLFAQARAAAGVGRAEVAAGTVESVLGDARRRFGPVFGDVLDHSAVWVNGSPTALDRMLVDDDEIAVLPPVSGGDA